MEECLSVVMSLISVLDFSVALIGVKKTNKRPSNHLYYDARSLWVLLLATTTVSLRACRNRCNAWSTGHLMFLIVQYRAASLLRCGTKAVTAGSHDFCS